MTERVRQVLPRAGSAALRSESEVRFPAAPGHIRAGSAARQAEQEKRGVAIDTKGQTGFTLKARDEGVGRGISPEQMASKQRVADAADTATTHQDLPAATPPEETFPLTAGHRIRTALRLLFSQGRRPPGPVQD